MSLLGPYDDPDLAEAYAEGVVDSLGGLPAVTAVRQLVLMAADRRNSSELVLTPAFIELTDVQLHRAARYIVAACSLNDDDLVARQPASAVWRRSSVLLLAAEVEGRWLTCYAHPGIAELDDEGFDVFVALTRAGRGAAGALAAAQALTAETGA